MRRKEIIRKLVIGLAGLLIVILSGIKFYRHRHMPEPVVIAMPGTVLLSLSTRRRYSDEV